MADTNFVDQTTVIVAAWLNAVNSLVYNYSVDTGAANAYVVASASTIAALTAGLSVRFKAANANTAASTLNVNSLGVKSIVTTAGTALPAGAISAGAIVTVTYDGTAWQMISSTSAIPLAAQITIADAGNYYTTKNVEAALQTAGATDATQNTNISTLQGQMTTANGNITTLQGQMTTANTNISTLQGQVTTLEGTLVRGGSFSAVGAPGTYTQNFASAFPTACDSVVITLPTGSTFAGSLNSFTAAHFVLDVSTNGVGYYMAMGH